MVDRRDDVLGIDIGGTGIKAAPVDISNGKLLEKAQKVPTPRPADPESMLPEIFRLIQSFKWNKRIGVGFPGVIKNGKVHTAANLEQAWLGLQLQAEIQKKVGQQTTVINDADAAALAEMKFGAGQSNNRANGGVVLMITLGTGIGSALFVNGHLVPNTEFGHMEMKGKDAEKWAATVIREREKLSWAEWGERVNYFLQAMELLLSPDLIIIGGGVSENPEKFFPYLHIKTRIVTADLTNDAGIVGAALNAIISS